MQDTNLKIRSQIDLRNEKIGFKIREHTLAKVPYFVIAGEKEVLEGKITVRKHDGTDLGIMSLHEFGMFLEKKTMKKGRVD